MMKTLSLFAAVLLFCCSVTISAERVAGQGRRRGAAAWRVG